MFEENSSCIAVELLYREKRMTIALPYEPYCNANEYVLET